MKNNCSHIISIFFLAVFLLQGVGSLLPFISFQNSKQDIAELLAKTETENSGKEKEEKISEKEWISHGIDLDFPSLLLAGHKKIGVGYPERCQNGFLNVITPPPKQA